MLPEKSWWVGRGPRLGENSGSHLDGSLLSWVKQSVPLSAQEALQNRDKAGGAAEGAGNKLPMWAKLSAGRALSLLKVRTPWGHGMWVSQCSRVFLSRFSFELEPAFAQTEWQQLLEILSPLLTGEPGCHARLWGPFFLCAVCPQSQGSSGSPAAGRTQGTQGLCPANFDLGCPPSCLLLFLLSQSPVS